MVLGIWDRDGNEITEAESLYNSFFRYRLGETIELISIGMVKENGEELYLENSEINLEIASEWVKENVIPKLTGNAISKKQIKEKVLEFAGESPEFWAYYSSYDWVCLCQLYGRMIDLPKGWPMYCKDFKQEMDRYNISVSKMDSKYEHNALADAKWLKDAYF